MLPIAKIVATSLSIGTGGSGGLFGPGIVIGAFVGAAVWRLGELSGLPGVPHDPGIFVVVGMMTCFGSVARAPLAIMIMVAEMTGSTRRPSAGSRISWPDALRLRAASRRR